MTYELLGLEPPGHLQGQSFVPLLEDTNAPGRQAVFPRWKNADMVKTERYSLTTWSNAAGKPIAEMMFDHELDRDEIANIAHERTSRLSKQELKSLLSGLEQDDE